MTRLTTIELTPEQGDRLLAVAMARGQDAQGVGRLVREAVERFLRHEEERLAGRKRALELRGRLEGSEAVELEARIRGLRERWR